MSRRPAALAFFLLFAAGAGADVRVAVDWPAFLSRHDLVWERTPRTWGEGAFTGNGLLGANTFQSADGRYLRWHVGRSDVTLTGRGASGSNPGADTTITNRIPVGDLVMVGPTRGLRMRLDLWNAEVAGEYEGSRGPVRFRSFTPSTPNVHVIEMTGEPDEEWPRFNWEPALALDPRLVNDHQPLLDTDRSPNPSRSADGPVTVSVQPLHDGGEHATAWIERVDGGRRVLLLSVGYARGKPGAAGAEAIAAVKQADEAGVERVAAGHRAWWHAYWPKSFVSLGDTRLESFYWIQMYKLASATRADRPAIDLMGPWYDHTPWPRIWWNLNIQLTYWPVLGANRLELGESLLRLIDGCAPQLAQNAGQWSADSAGIGRTSSYDCRSPVTRELCNLPWALHNYWLHYRHTMDDALLRERLLPLLRRSMSFYRHLLVKGGDGKLHLPRGMSPEYDARADHTDTAIDIALLRWGLETILESNRRLREKDPREAEWRDTLAALAPHPADANGLRVSADTAYTTSHRHYSHLFAIFPLYLLQWDRPADRDLITRSFDHWMSLPQRFRGYSWTGAASIAASIGRPDDAVKHLVRLLEAPEFPILPNTFYREAGPVIETPLSGASALHDLLLQSWGGTLRVFPGAGAAWKDVVFHGLRAQGAFLVSAARRGGQTRFIRIESLAGEPCRVITGMAAFRTEPRVAVKRLAGGVVELGLRRGQSVVLVPEGPADLLVAPVAPQGKINSFGLP